MSRLELDGSNFSLSYYNLSGSIRVIIFEAGLGMHRMIWAVQRCTFSNFSTFVSPSRVNHAGEAQLSSGLMLEQ